VPQRGAITFSRLRSCPGVSSSSKITADPGALVKGGQRRCARAVATATPACLCRASARPARSPAPQACQCPSMSSARRTSSQLQPRAAHEAAPQVTSACAWVRTRRQACMHSLRTGCAESSDWYVWPMTCSPAVCARRRSSSRLSVVLRAKRLRCPLTCTPAWPRRAASGGRRLGCVCYGRAPDRGLQESPSRRAPAPARPPAARLRSLPARSAASSEARRRPAQLVPPGREACRAAESHHGSALHPAARWQPGR